MLHAHRQPSHPEFKHILAADTCFALQLCKGTLSFLHGRTVPAVLARDKG